MTSRILAFTLYLLLAMGLASCASTSEYGAQDFQSVVSVDGMSYVGGLDLRDPRFYENDDRELAPILRDPRCC